MKKFIRTLTFTLPLIAAVGVPIAVYACATCSLVSNSGATSATPCTHEPEEPDFDTLECTHYNWSPYAPMCITQGSATYCGTADGYAYANYTVLWGHCRGVCLECTPPRTVGNC